MYRLIAKRIILIISVVMIHYCLQLLAARAYHWNTDEFGETTGVIGFLAIILLLMLDLPFYPILSGIVPISVIVLLNGFFWATLIVVIVMLQPKIQSVDDVHSHRCPMCGYNLHGLIDPNECPECGCGIPEYLKRRLKRVRFENQVEAPGIVEQDMNDSNEPGEETGSDLLCRKAPR